MNEMHLIKGLVKTIPGIEKLYNFYKPIGGSNTRYCYSVWLRHLIHSYNNGFKEVPRKIAELGPGDSIGVGLAAVITGTVEYYAFDVVRYANVDNNLKIFEELVALFRARTVIPDNNEFPNIAPTLPSYEFPHHILTDEYLDKMLDETRLNKIRKAIQEIDSDQHSSEFIIKYQVPWTDESNFKNDSLDMIFSQAVLEHVNDLDLTYNVIYKWLKPGGWTSNSIDFRSHYCADTWDGHWTYSDLQWKIVKGRKTYLINRDLYSTHLRLLKEKNYQTLFTLTTQLEPKIKRKQLAKRYAHATDEDLRTTTGYIIAKK